METGPYELLSRRVAGHWKRPRPGGGDFYHVPLSNEGHGTSAEGELQSSRTPKRGKFYLSLSLLHLRAFTFPFPRLPLPRDITATAKRVIISFFPFPGSARAVNNVDPFTFPYHPRGKRGYRSVGTFIFIKKSR